MLNNLRSSQQGFLRKQIMKLKTLSVFGLSAMVAALAITGTVVTRAYGQDAEKTEIKASAEQPKPMSKITPPEAIAIALKKMVGGRPLQANFEFDEGHWVYGVMVVKDHKITEVEIDPMTGKVGDSEDVTPAGEAKEIQDELGKAIAAN